MIIDANVGLGRFASGIGADFAQPEATLRYLKTTGIGKALVYSTLAREADAEEGNRIVLEACEKHPEYIPSWVISPYETDIDASLACMRAHHIRVARLFPELGHFSVYPSCLGPIVDRLQRANKVLFIDFDAKSWASHAIDYDGIYQLCQAYPKIPVVLVGSTITGSRNYPNIIQKCRNLYLEISQMFQPEGVFRLVKQGFGRRLIFGSGFPVRAPGAMLNMLAYSGISQRELADICCNNVLTLLDGTRRNEHVELAKPQKRMIIDLHVHQGKLHPVPSGTETAVGIIRNMDRCGIHAAIVTSLWACYGEVRRGNRAVAEACASYPDRLYGYLTLDPKYPEECQNEIKMYGGNPSFRGIKIHCDLHGLAITHPLYRPILAYADKRKWPVLCHAGVNPGQWERVSATYKNARFIVAHVGAADGTIDSYFVLADLARKRRNLYLDLACSGITPGVLEKITARAGADRVTFGSDHPLFDFAYESGRVVASSLSEREKDLIFSGNAKKLLRIRA